MRTAHGSSVVPIDMTNGNFFVLKPDSPSDIFVVHSPGRSEVCQKCGADNEKKTSSSVEELLTESAISTALTYLGKEVGININSSSGTIPLFDKDWDLDNKNVICGTCGTSQLSRPQISLSDNGSFYDDATENPLKRRERSRMWSGNRATRSKESFDFIDRDETEMSSVIIEEIEEEEPNRQSDGWDDVPVKGLLKNSESFEKIVTEKLKEEEDDIMSGAETVKIPQEVPPVPNEASESIWSIRKELPVDVSHPIPKILTPEDYKMENDEILELEEPAAESRRVSFITPLDELYKKYNHQPIHANGVIRVVQTPPPPRRITTVGHLRRSSSCGTIDTYGDALRTRPFWYIDENSVTTTASSEAEEVKKDVKAVEEEQGLKESLCCLICFPLRQLFSLCKWGSPVSF